MYITTPGGAKTILSPHITPPVLSWLPGYREGLFGFLACCSNSAMIMEGDYGGFMEGL